MATGNRIRNDSLSALERACGGKEKAVQRCTASMRTVGVSVVNVFAHLDFL